MSKRGGYIIIDLKGIDLFGNDVKIEGISKAVLNAYKKTVLISGIVIDSVEYPDAFVVIKSSVIDVYGYKLKVGVDDTIKTESLTGTATIKSLIEDIPDMELSYNGNVVTINHSFPVFNPIEEGTIMFKIPADFAPITGIQTVDHTIVGAPSTVINIDTDGNISPGNSNLSTGLYHLINISYIRR